MALDSRITFATQTPNIGKIFKDVLTNVGALDTLKENRELAPLRQQALIDTGALREQQIESAQLGNASDRDKNRFNSVVQGANELLPFLENQDLSGANAVLQARRNRLLSQGIDDTRDTDDALNLLQTNPGLLQQRTLQAVQMGRQLMQQGQSAGQRERSDLLRDLNSDDPNVVQSAEVALGLTAKAGLSAVERIAADPTLSEQVVNLEGAKAGAKEGAKLVKKLKFEPLIRKAVKLAETEAAERGEVLTDLARMQAALPGLNDAVSQLRELAPIATSTLIGRASDAAARETGFGATKGGTARVKYTSIIQNQVLPLLKPTFGAAFTVTEGDKLEATMGDVNLAPGEKLAALDAFIAQKIRDIEAKQTQLGAPEAAPEVDLTTLSDEELLQLRQGL